MARLKMRIDKNGDTFKVANLCNPDSPTDCVGSFKNLLGSVAEFDDGEVQYTNEYFQHQELPAQLETIDENGED